MAPQQRYILEDFLKFARTNFPTEFAPVANLNIYRFEDKTCQNENQQAKEGTLLFIGRYFYTKRGDSFAWAHASSSGITYYSAKSTSVCKPIPARYEARIYHDEPYSQMFSAEGPNLRHRDPTQAVREAVIESVINFAFFYTGRLAYVDNVKGTDMLNNFKFACMTFAKNSGVELVASRSLLERPRVPGGSEVRCSSARARNLPIPPIQASRSDLAGTPLMSVEHEDAGTELDASHFQRLSAQQSSSRASVIDKLSDWEATIRAESAAEIAILKTKLAAQKGKTDAARSKLGVQKGKRRATEAELEDMRAKHVQMEDKQEREKLDYAQLQRDCKGYVRDLNESRDQNSAIRKELVQFKALYSGVLAGKSKKIARKGARKAVKKMLKADTVKAKIRAGKNVV